MGDRIIGTSVLQPIWIEGIYRLWFKGQKADGSVSQGWIFIKDGASVGLVDRVPNYPEECNYVWRFSRRATIQELACSPSVNWISWNFHNEAAWTTNYVEMPLSECAESKAGPEPTRYERASAVHYDLNWASPTPEERQRLISELRSNGVLK